MAGAGVRGRDSTRVGPRATRELEGTSTLIQVRSYMYAHTSTLIQVRSWLGLPSQEPWEQVYHRLARGMVAITPDGNGLGRGQVRVRCSRAASQ